MIEFKSSFIEQITELMGASEAKALLEALASEAPSSIRFNQEKSGQADQSTSFPYLDKVVPWCPWAYYLTERPLFTADPLFHLGYYYVQEASSMLLYQIREFLQEDKPMVALDLCAAPGGKSTLLQDILPKGSLLVSNEVVPNRANILVENMQKWGSPMSIVTSSMPDKWSKVKEAFDLILVDAPCSGEGMFRKEAIARQEWQADSPLICAERQRGILSDIYESLNRGGLLVYSTCTFNKQENEDIVAYIMDTFDVESLAIDDLPQGVVLSPYSPYPCYRMMPHKLEGEGLFMAVFRKKGSDSKVASSRQKLQSKKKKRQSKQHSQAIPSELKSYISNADSYQWCLEKDDVVYAYDKLLYVYLNILRNHKIAVLSAGIPIAQIKGKSLIPHSALALSTELSREHFDAVELSLEQAICYLGRQNIDLSPELSKGIKLLTYQGQAMGFAKHLGNRTNNLYPNEWRIRQWEIMIDSIKKNVTI